jgi:hypothetical protein
MLAAVLFACSDLPTRSGDTSSYTFSSWPEVADCTVEGPCCNPAKPWFSACVEGGWGPREWEGEFTAWGTDALFLTADGEVLELTFDGLQDGGAPAIDLGLAGPVTLTLEGDCGWGPATALHVADSAGQTLLLVSTIGVTDLAGWTVEPVQSTTWCEGRGGAACFQWLHDRPIRFAHGGTTAELMQGEESDLDGYRVGVNVSQTASGKIGCTDVVGELTNWWVVPASLP